MNRGQGQNGHPSGWPPQPHYTPHMLPQGLQGQAPAHHPLGSNGMMGGQAWGNHGAMAAGGRSGHFPAPTFTPTTALDMSQEHVQHPPRAYTNSTPNHSERYIQNAHPHESPSGSQPFLPHSQPGLTQGAVHQFARSASGPQSVRRPETMSQLPQHTGTSRPIAVTNGLPPAPWQPQPQTQTTSVAALRQRYENHSQPGPSPAFPPPEAAPRTVWHNEVSPSNSLTNALPSSYIGAAGHPEMPARVQGFHPAHAAGSSTLEAAMSPPPRQRQNGTRGHQSQPTPVVSGSSQGRVHDHYMKRSAPSTNLPELQPADFRSLDTHSQPVAISPPSTLAGAMGGSAPRARPNESARALQSAVGYEQFTGSRSQPQSFRTGIEPHTFQHSGLQQASHSQVTPSRPLAGSNRASTLSSVPQGLQTPDGYPNFNAYTSPQSARSGPESPDPLNLISPVKGARVARQGSPTPRSGLPQPSWLSTQAKSLSSLGGAMGDSMRPSLSTGAKRKGEESSKKTSAAKKAKTNGPSPIKAGSFYSESSGPSRSVTPVDSGSQKKAAQPAKARGRPKGSKAKNGAGSNPQTPKKADTPRKTKAKKARGGTTFTSSLPLALPVYDSSSAEEWDKDGEYEVDDDDDFEITPQPSRMASNLNGTSFQTPTTNGPSPMVRPSTSVIKNADRRSPMKKLLDFFEDLFEAEDGLPDREALAEASEEMAAPVSDFFVIVNHSAVVKPQKLHHMARLIRTCAARNRSQQKSAPRNTDTPADEGQPEPASLGEIDIEIMQRILRVLAATIKIADGVDPFPTRDIATTAPKKAVKKTTKRRKPAKSPTQPRNGSESADDDNAEEEEDEAERESRAESLVEADEGEEGDKDVNKQTEDARDSAPGQARANGPETTQEEQQTLGEQLSQIATALMGVDCCLSVLSVDGMDPSLISEDIIRPCFETMRSALEQIVFPFVEACSSMGVVKIHPLLEAWMLALAPRNTKRGRKKKVAQEEPNSLDPSGIFAGCGEYLASIFKSSCSTMLQAQKLVRLPSIALSDSILYSVIYAGMGPFFALEPEVMTGNSEAAKTNARGRRAMEALAPGAGGGGTAMKSLRSPALNLLCNVFARHPDQRQWIIEELLGSLIKLPDMKKNRRQHQLRNGKAINSITALLLQLVQTASHGILGRLGPQASSVGSGTALQVAEAASQRATEADPHEDGPLGMDIDTPSPPHGSDGPDDLGLDYDILSFRRALDGPTQASWAIAAFLMAKISSVKVNKSSGEFSYASVVENLVTDLLTTVFLPEWPSSGLLLSSLYRSFAATINDSRTTPDAKGVALEQVGLIAAHLRQSQLKVENLRPTEQSQLQGVRATPQSLASIEKSRDVDALGFFNDAYAAVLDYLGAADVDDHASKSAIDFFVCQWGSELATSLVRTAPGSGDAQDPSDQDEVDRIKVFVSAIHRSSRLLSKYGRMGPEAAGDIFNVRSLEDYSAVCAISEQLAHTAPFMIPHESSRSLLVSAVNVQAVGNRTKALRGLTALYGVDSSMLDSPLVRDTIETSLSDESASVRETAVTLLSRRLLAQPDDMEELYAKLSQRALDSGLAVRKRMLKLLASIYRSLPSKSMRVDACTRMVLYIHDEDVGLQDLAVQTLGEIWLGLQAEEGTGEVPNGQSTAVGQTVVSDADGENAINGTGSHDHDTSSSDDVAIILAVVRNLRGQPQPLQEVFRRFRKNRSGHEASRLLERLRSLSDSLISDLDEEAANPDATSARILTKVKTIHLVVSTNPAVLSITKAKSLLTHFRTNRRGPDDLQVVEFLMKIFCISLPLMPKTSLAFAKQLESQIGAQLNNPPPSIPTLQELTSCFVTGIRTHTNNFDKLIHIGAIFLKKLRQLHDQVRRNTSAALTPTTRIIMSEAALIFEKADFDALRTEKPELAAGLTTAFGKETVRDQAYTLFIGIHRSDTHRLHALACIGFLFRGFPLLMEQKEGTQLLEAAFASKVVAEQEILLRNLVDFVTTDIARRAPDTNTASASASDALDLHELVGDTESWADSGVGTTLLERYLKPICACALRIDAPSVQRPAMQLVEYIVMQAVSHPFESLPTLVSLETLADRSIADRALKLHAHFASKYASILASRYGELIKAAFEFQLTLHSNAAQALRGYRIDTSTGGSIALLHSWYSFVRDKRQTRLDFLKAMTRTLDIDTTSFECEPRRVLLSRFVADNLAVLDYKTLEEVFVVVAELKRILAVTGAQVKHVAEEFISSRELGTSIEDLDLSRAPVLDAIYMEDEVADVAGLPPAPTAPTGYTASQQPSQSYSQTNGSHGPGVETQQDLFDASQGARPNPGIAERLAGHADEPVADRSNRRLPADAGRLSIIMGTALLLRNHLKLSYGLTEDRCSKYVPDKKQSAGADRPATRKDGRGGPLSFRDMPHALQPDAMESAAVAVEQMTTFESLMDAEGTLAEDDDDWEAGL